DRVYLSADTMLQTTVDPVLGSFQHSGNLAPEGGQYSRTESFLLPEGISGSFYIFVETDAANAEPEGPGEQNNRNYAPVDVQLQSSPDLRVTQVDFDGGVAGEEVLVTWEVINGGTQQLSGSWMDYVYLSADDVLDPAGDVRVGSLGTSGTLTIGGTYRREDVAVTLPHDIEGTYHVIVLTDAWDSVAEYAPGAEDNNATASTVETISWVPPDLVVQTITPPSSAASGEPAVVGWTVANAGDRPTHSGRWVDRVYLSADGSLDVGTDILMGTFEHVGDLGASGATYDGEGQVMLPEGLDGTYHLFVVTDALGQVAESDGEDNNVSSTPFTVALTPPPDLQVTSVTGPEGPLYGGFAIDLTWRVENLGAGPAEGSSWQDAVYLSADTSLDVGTDVELGKTQHIGALGTTAGFDNFYIRRDVSVSLPDDAEGAYYLFVVTDADENLYEHLDEGNNAAYDPTPINVLAPVYDLAAAGVTVDENAVAGAAVTVTWHVDSTETGPMPVDRWEDAIYLSEDAVLQRGSDTVLASVRHTGALPTGGGYD
ncbi:MAG: CARDB domain-containing protein, partial [Phycisphaerae bacterium]